MQGRTESAFRGDEAREALEPLGERFGRFVSRRQGGRGVGAGVDFVAEDRGDEVRALREVAVEGAGPHARLGGDLTHGCVDSRGGEDFRGRREQGVGAALRVGTQPLTGLPFRRGGAGFPSRFLAHDASPC